jgi:hypothetical protein
MLPAPPRKYSGWDHRDPIWKDCERPSSHPHVGTRCHFDGNPPRKNRERLDLSGSTLSGHAEPSTIKDQHAKAIKLAQVAPSYSIPAATRALRDGLPTWTRTHRLFLQDTVIFPPRSATFTLRSRQSLPRSNASTMQRVVQEMGKVRKRSPRPRLVRRRSNHLY